MKNYQVDAMATTAYNFDTQTYDWKKNNGLGGSIDIGISFVKNKYKTYRDQEFEYDYKFSAALLDLGFISFKGENHTYRLNAQSLINFDTFQQNTNSLQDFSPNSVRLFMGILTGREFPIPLKSVCLLL